MMSTFSIDITLLSAVDDINEIHLYENNSLNIFNIDFNYLEFLSLLFLVSQKKVAI